MHYVQYSSPAQHKLQSAKGNCSLLLTRPWARSWGTTRPPTRTRFMAHARAGTKQASRANCHADLQTRCEDPPAQLLGVSAPRWACFGRCHEHGLGHTQDVCAAHNIRCHCTPSKVSSSYWPTVHDLRDRSLSLLMPASDAVSSRRRHGAQSSPLQRLSAWRPFAVAWTFRRQRRGAASAARTSRPAQRGCMRA